MESEIWGCKRLCIWMDAPTQNKQQCLADSKCLTKIETLYYCICPKNGPVWLYNAVMHPKDVAVLETMEILIGLILNFTVCSDLSVLKVGSCPNYDNFVLIFFCPFCAVFK